MHTWRYAGVVAWLAVGVTAGQAQEGKPATALPDPVPMLKQRDAQVEKLIAGADTSSKAVKEQLKEILNGVIDFEELAKRALGKYWNERTAEEQRDFVDVFRQLIRNSSVRKLDVYKADRVEYDPPTFRGPLATVRMVAHKKDSSMEVEYRLHPVNGEWRIYDLVVDDVSTARNYRDGFYRKLAKTSFADMMVELRGKLTEGTDQGADTL